MRYYGMTTESEQMWCRHFVEMKYTGEGEIVELGPWMGALTVSMATGLLRRNILLPEKVIHAYDQWTWQPYMDKYRIPGIECKTGESFLPEFKKRLGWLKIFVAIQGDILKSNPFELPVELLVVDAMKSWPLTNAILRNFYPRIIPETGFLFHQDYVFWACPWIHMIQWMLQDYFCIQEEINSASTMVFRLLKPVERKFFEKTYNYDSFSETEIRDAFKYSRYLTQSRRWERIDNAEKFMLYGRRLTLNGERVKPPSSPADIPDK